MLPKKYIKADLNQYRSIFFLVGLVVVLFLTWQVLELKVSYKEKEEILSVVNVEDNTPLDIPITEKINLPPPPQPLAIPEVIEIVDDNEEVEESIIESTETNQEEAITNIVKVDDVEVVEEEEIIEVPFAVIENVPVFPGCEGLSQAKQRDCFQEKMMKHVQKHFKYPSMAQELGIQGKVYVQFSIGPDGVVSEIRSRGPDESLEKEAERIIKLLPKMQPGKQRGTPVKVPYSIPITFKLQQ